VFLMNGQRLERELPQLTHSFPTPAGRLLGKADDFSPGGRRLVKSTLPPVPQAKAIERLRSDVHTQRGGGTPITRLSTIEHARSFEYSAERERFRLIATHAVTTAREA
jgi:hypothetical protein